MFNHAFLGSSDFLERLQGTLCGFQEFRARRRVAQHAAYASPAATMHAAPGTRSAPTESPPGGGLVLLCYQHVQGRLVPVYGSPDDLLGATAHGGAPSPEIGPRRPEPAPHGTTTPASPPPAAPSGGSQERTPPASEARTPVAAPVEPPDFSAQAVQASVPRTSTRPATPERAPATLNLAPPTPPSIVRPTEEKIDTIERLLAQHRTDTEATEARHAAAMQELHAHHRAEMEVSEARHAATVQELHAQQRADMEAAEARHTAGLHDTLAKCRHMVSELLVQQQEALGPQQRPDADNAQAFTELRELLAEQARVMQAEHDATARLTSDLLEMINNLGETVNHLAVTVAERKAPLFAPPPRRSLVSNHDAVHKPGPPAARGPEPIMASRAASTTATGQNPEPAPAATQAGVAAPTPVSAKSAAPNAESPATSPVPLPAAHDAAPPRSLTVVRDAEPTRRAPTPAVRHTAPLLSAPARACATPVSASLMSLFATPSPATASALMTPRQRKAAEEARERHHIHDVVSDIADEDLEDTRIESEVPRG